jgi:hypothetical protein
MTYLDIARQVLKATSAIGGGPLDHAKSPARPELAEGPKTHEMELPAVLGHAGGPGARDQGQPGLGTDQRPCRRCGSPEYIDVPIHNGQSVRRDCARCGRFIAFVLWYGRLMQPGAN